MLMTTPPRRKGRPREPGRHPIDIQVGLRIRAQRQFVGLSQTELGNHLGITFQQIQKYEKGTNRVSSSKLFEIAGILHVPVAFFFEGVSEQTAPVPTELRALQALALLPENMHLVEALNRIPTQRQKAIRRLIEAIAEVEPAAEADD